MSSELISKIALEAARAAQADAAKSVVAQQGGDMVASTPQEFADFISAERKCYADIVRDAPKFRSTRSGQESRAR